MAIIQSKMTTEQKAIFDKMFNDYASISKASHFKLGFVVDGRLCVYTCELSEARKYCRIDVASNQEISLRFELTLNERRYLARRSEVFQAEILESYTKKGYNKGHVFENFIHSLNGNNNYQQDNIPFYIGADIEIDGIGYEVKFEKGTLATTTSLANGKKRLGL